MHDEISFSLLHPAQDVKHPSVQQVQATYITHLIVTMVIQLLLLAHTQVTLFYFNIAPKYKTSDEKEVSHQIWKDRLTLALSGNAAGFTGKQNSVSGLKHPLRYLGHNLHR